MLKLLWEFINQTGFAVYSLSNYFVWGVSELQVTAKPHNKIEDLFQKMKEVKGSLDRDTKAKTC